MHFSRVFPIFLLASAITALPVVPGPSDIENIQPVTRTYIKRIPQDPVAIESPTPTAIPSFADPLQELLFAIISRLNSENVVKRDEQPAVPTTTSLPFTTEEDIQNLVQQLTELLAQDGVAKRDIEEALLDKRSFWDWLHNFLSGTGQGNPTVAEPVENPARQNSKRDGMGAPLDKRSFWDWLHRFLSGTGQPNPTVAEPVANPATQNSRRDIMGAPLDKRSFWDWLHRFLSGTGQPNPTVAQPVENPATMNPQ